MKNILPFFVLFFISCTHQIKRDPAALLPENCIWDNRQLNDQGQINLTKVAVYCEPASNRFDIMFNNKKFIDDSENNLQEILQFAKDNKFKISISGKRHSQGGQSLYPGTVHINMLKMSAIIFSKEERLKRHAIVQSGVVWEQLQQFAKKDGLFPEKYEDDYELRHSKPNEYIPDSLVVKVQQSSDIFSIGGSMSVNCHGRDINFGTIINTINSFRILLADGRIVEAKKDADFNTESGQLFRLAIGGYGLFGIILTVDIQLHDNVMLEKETVMTDYKNYNAVFKKDIYPDKSVKLHFGRLNIVETDKEKFLNEMYYVTMREVKKIDKWRTINSDEYSEFNRWFVEMGERYSWIKKWRWNLQLSKIDIPGKTETLSLVEAMNPEIESLLGRRDKESVDILQEYFIPVEQYANFIEQTKRVFLVENVNIQSITIRHIPKDELAFLTYAQKEVYAVVMYINIQKDSASLKHSEGWTQKLIDLSLNVGGTYYLAYQLWPKNEQLLKAYPRWREFVNFKKKFDPEEFFYSNFYHRYKGAM
jgi:FAD/FMN-containing dehydrogenase